MKMEDSLRVRHRKATGFTEEIIRGVHCLETIGIQKDAVGHAGNGQMIVRIPGEQAIAIRLGDEICRVGSYTWFTVVEIQDNRLCGSHLSHFKIVGKR